MSIDLESEHYVLGALLTSNRVLHEIADAVSADDFDGDGHSLIFATASAMIAACEPCDCATLADRMNQHGTLERVGGFARLGSIAADTISTANVRARAQLVREYAMRRKLIECAERVLKAGCRSDSAELRALMQSGLANIEAKSPGNVVTFADAINAASAEMTQACKRRDEGEPIGITTGLFALDTAIGGFAKGQLWTIAARPGVGKTALALQIGLRAAEAGSPGLIVSLEMQPHELATRAMALRSGKNVAKLLRGYRDEVREADAHGVHLMTLPLHIDARSRQLDRIVARIGQYANRQGIQWAIIDHIGLAETKAYSTRNDQVGAVSRGLKSLAIEANVAIIGLSQLNRGSEKDARRPGLADLRDSGNIEQDVDGAIFLHRKAARSDGTVHLELGVLKNRNGPCSWLENEIVFDGRVQKFSEPSRA